MAFDETVYITLEGGIVNPISHVTGAYTTANVVIYDGSVYRDEMDGAYQGRAWAATTTFPSASGATPEGQDDRLNHTAPRYVGKQRTLWSFPRTVSAAAGFTHVVWADLVLCTGSHPPYRLGMTPTTIS